MQVADCWPSKVPLATSEIAFVQRLHDDDHEVVDTSPPAPPVTDAFANVAVLLQQAANQAGGGDNVETT